MNRARLFSAILGFVLAVLGVARDDRRLITVSLVTLSVALALRLWSRYQARRTPSETTQSS